MHAPLSSEFNCNTLQHTATKCNTLQQLTLQHTATQCNPLQQTATHCKTLQHSSQLYAYFYCHLSMFLYVFLSLLLWLSPSYAHTLLICNPHTHLVQVNEVLRIAQDKHGDNAKLCSGSREVCVCVNACVYICIYIFIYTYICSYMYIHTCIFICIHIYIYMYIYVCINVCIYIYMYINSYNIFLCEIFCLFFQKCSVYAVYCNVLQGVMTLSFLQEAFCSCTCSLSLG